jgi:hypothetical protein
MILSGLYSVTSRQTIRFNTAFCDSWKSSFVFSTNHVITLEARRVKASQRQSSLVPLRNWLVIIILNNLLYSEIQLWGTSVALYDELIKTKLMGGCKMMIRAV